LPYGTYLQPFGDPHKHSSYLERELSLLCLSQDTKKNVRKSDNPYLIMKREEMAAKQNQNFLSSEKPPSPRRRNSSPLDASGNWKNTPPDMNKYFPSNNSEEFP